uniref:NADH dehydrogenase [ubiquinone] 1 alpha subcomplex subunit 5 n=1 Tax=Vombatus ursinus TaxID=29139 RepID=A0A4X2K0W7_VOMUR
MTRVLKKTTGLTGLEVCETPQEERRLFYSKILDALEFMPSNAAYKKYTEQITKAERVEMAIIINVKYL